MKKIKYDIYFILIKYSIKYIEYYLYCKLISKNFNKFKNNNIQIL